MHLLGSRTRNEDIWGKEEKGKVRFLISLDISQSREAKHTTTDAGGGGRCTLRVVINLARHA